MIPTLGCGCNVRDKWKDGIRRGGWKDGRMEERKNARME
jgi:hypothetical protein